MAADFGELAQLGNLTRFGNPSVLLATKNAVGLASPLLWCLGATNHGRTGTLGAISELAIMIDISQQTCQSRLRSWSQELVDS